MAAVGQRLAADTIPIRDQGVRMRFVGRRDRIPNGS